MRIDKVACTQFAGIQNRELHFDGGINIVFGKNESGKSTIVNLISRLLFQNARIDGRSDKDFRELYFPAARKGSSIAGDFADGRIAFETESGSYELSKEWGKDPRCTLATPNGIIRDQETISRVLKDALVYGEGVYTEMLLSPQRTADAVLAGILDASKKTAAKQEIINAVSAAFAEGDGISAEALGAAIDKNIDDLAGKHWDIERAQPMRKTGGGEWLNGLGKVLEAYYRFERYKVNKDRLNALESAADAASEKCKRLEDAMSEAQGALESFNSVFSAIALRSSKCREAERLEKDLSKLNEVLSVWPENERKLNEARALKAEKELADLAERFASAKKVKDELDEVEAGGNALCPDETEIAKVRSAQSALLLLESRLRGMDITAAVKLFNGHSIEVRSLRTGELLDVSSDNVNITEAVSLTIPGVVEMTLAPASIDAQTVKNDIAKHKSEITEVFLKYNVDCIEKLEKMRTDSQSARIKAEQLRSKLELQLAGISFGELEERAHSAVSTRTPYEIDKAIFTLCGDFDVVRFITAKETVIKGYIDEYGSMDELRKRAESASSELENARASVAITENVPQQYAGISDPEAHLAMLKKRCEIARMERDTAMNEKTAAASRLEMFMMQEGDGVEERLQKAEQEFEEKKTLLAHWLHIREVFNRVKEAVKNDPTGDIAVKLAEYLGIITGGGLISDFKEGTLDMSVYSENRLMDHNKLSEGTKETVSLAYRLAVLDHLFPDGGGVMVLDDPLTDMDNMRAERSCDIIRECAKRHQIIFLTCREDYCDMLGGKRIDI